MLPVTKLVGKTTPKPNPNCQLLTINLAQKGTFLCITSYHISLFLELGQGACVSIWCKVISNSFIPEQNDNYKCTRGKRCFTKHKPHAGCNIDHTLPTLSVQSHQPPWWQWNDPFCCMTLFAASALQYIFNWEEICPWWPWPLTLTFKLVQAKDQTCLPCEFGTTPFSSSWDISYHTTTTVSRPFSGTTRVSRCQKRMSGLYGARED